MAVTIIVNEHWAEGLSASIRIGLTAMEKEEPGMAAVILAVADQPQLTPALLDSLIDESRVTGKKIIAAQYAGVPGPPALFGASFFAQLKTLQGDEGARRLLRENPDAVGLVPFPDGAMDVDTREDVARLGDAPTPVRRRENACDGGE
jgi:molybdenum cofactor cytidylyltransferase